MRILALGATQLDRLENARNERNRRVQIRSIGSRVNAEEVYCASSYFCLINKAQHTER